MSCSLTVQSHSAVSEVTKRINIERAHCVFLLTRIIVSIVVKTRCISNHFCILGLAICFSKTDLLYRTRCTEEELRPSILL